MGKKMENGKIKTSTFQKVVGVLSLLIMIIVLIVFFFQYLKLPQEIAVHFNFEGQPDRYGSKSEMFVLIVAFIGIYLLLTFVSRAPSMWNSGVEVTEENKEKVYSICKDLIYMIRLHLVITFSYITLCSVMQKNMGNYFVIIVLVSLFSIMGFYFIRLLATGKKKTSSLS